MSIGGVSGASAAMQLAASRLEGVAKKTAAGESDPAADAGVMVGAKVQMAAAVTVARTANAMMGTLVDMLI